jgi:hypothetical protein
MKKKGKKRWRPDGGQMEKRWRKDGEKEIDRRERGKEGECLLA